MKNISSKRLSLYKAQDDIFLALNQIKNFPFVLSGGTALSRFYFHHRLSEDLDFFNEVGEFSFIFIEKIIQHLRMQGFRCSLTGTTNQLGLLKIASYEVKKACVIKIDFLEDPFSGMWKPLKKKTESGVVLRVDSLDQIYYRKLFSLVEQYHRTGKVQRVKDWVDLFFLHTHFRSLDKTLSFYRREQIPVDEEKIIIMLDALKKEDLTASKKILSFPVKPEQIYDSLKKVGQKILNRGFL